MNRKSAEKLKAAIEKAWLELPNTYIGDDPQYLHMDKVIEIIDSMTEEESEGVKVVEVEKLKEFVKIESHYGWRDLGLYDIIKLVDSLAVEREPMQTDAIESELKSRQLGCPRGYVCTSCADTKRCPNTKAWKQLEALKARNP